MSDERKDLPAITSPNFLQRVREALQTYTGSQGDLLDRGVTLRDLSDAGLIDISKTYRATRRGAPVAGAGPNAGGGGQPGPPGTPGPPGPPGTPGDAYEPDLTPPPSPTGFMVSAAISHLFIGCDAQTYTQGHGHLSTRVYGATWTSGALPVFANATVLTEFSGTVFAHATNPATTWHLWITWVTRDGVESASPAGGTNGLVATTGQDVSLLLQALTGQITQSQLYVDLGSRIDLIDGSGLGSVNARLASQAAAVQTEASTRATQTGELYAKYTVKVDVAGLVSGYGLASTANNAAPTSSFGVRANSFFVAPPAVAQATAPTANLYDGFVWLDTSVTPNVTRYRSGSSWVLNAPALPFVVQATPTTVNGVAVPAGVYANDLFVKNGTITNAKIANLAVDDAKIANLSVSKLTAGSLAVGQYVQSTNYVPNVSGWQWRADGSAELGSQYIRGKLTAAQIDTRGLDIRDASGNVILSSGSSLHSQVGPFAGLSKITGTNISTYIADLAVNTLQIANNAVTIPVGAALTSDVYTTSLSPVGALSVYLESRGAPIFISFEAALLAMDVSENWQNQKGYLVLLVNGAEVRRIDTNATFGRLSFKNVSAQHYVQSTGFGTTIQLAICSSRSQTETSVHTQWYQLYGGIYGGTSLFAIGTKR